jgi:hypothetical protein
MMKVLLTIAFLFINQFLFAQLDSVGLKVAMQKLDNALLQKDEVVLKTVLDNDVNFGHSNGWIQTKSDVLNDFKTGKLVYNIIENNSSAILSINKKWATVKTNTNAEGTVNGTAFKLTLHVMQVWMKTKKGWQLMARQSTKIS